MINKLRADSEIIINTVISDVLPDEAVKRALKNANFNGRIFLIAVGKAAWQMAKAATDSLGNFEKCIVITKYNHIQHDLKNVLCYEAGHPVPDENSFIATQAVLDMTSGLIETDTILFLLSGGGSALFEKSLIPVDELQNITNQLLGCGADIVEINTLRKRLSAVKGGKFAMHCFPAQVHTIVLSDILGDPLDMIASGPTVADLSTCEEAIEIAKKYKLNLSDSANTALGIETPKHLDNIKVQIIGSVRELCKSAERVCNHLGYETIFLTDELCCEAKDAGSFFSSIIKSNVKSGKKLAFIAGGETIVHLKGNGLGGRNQELALSASLGVDGIKNAALFSIGSDGTDGPTDAAGGYVDGDTVTELKVKNLNVTALLENNDAYNALKATDGLIFTGATGTNVNDLTVALIN